jgi:hypothetical protein
MAPPPGYDLPVPGCRLSHGSADPPGAPARPGRDHEPAARVVPVGRQAALLRDLGLSPPGQSCTVIDVTSADLDLPDPHIYGDTVLQTIFDQPLGPLIQVYSRRGRTVSELKSLLLLEPDAQLVATDSRSFLMNCDYWVITKFGEAIQAVSPIWPVTQTLRVISTLPQNNTHDMVRVLHHFISWPWHKVDADVPQLLQQLHKSIIDSPEEVELEAINLGYASARDFLERAAREVP